MTRQEIRYTLAEIYRDLQDKRMIDITYPSFTRWVRQLKITSRYGVTDSDYVRIITLVKEKNQAPKPVVSDVEFDPVAVGARLLEDSFVTEETKERIIPGTSILKIAEETGAAARATVYRRYFNMTGKTKKFQTNKVYLLSEAKRLLLGWSDVVEPASKADRN